jgi:hypothetical protein
MLKMSLWVVGFALVCAAAVAIRLDHVHGLTGEWRMRPSAEPVLLRYHGGIYDREGTDPARQAGFRKRGQDIGGGQIFAPRSLTAPSALQVRSLGRFYDYRLAG